MVARTRLNFALQYIASLVVCLPFFRMLVQESLPKYNRVCELRLEFFLNSYHLPYFAIA